MGYPSGELDWGHLSPCFSLLPERPTSEFPQISIISSQAEIYPKEESYPFIPVVLVKKKKAYLKITPPLTHTVKTARLIYHVNMEVTLLHSNPCGIFTY
jgi:hypothetical protein